MERAPIPSEQLRQAAGLVVALAGPTAFTILWVGKVGHIHHPSIYTAGFSLLMACFAALILLAVTAPEGNLLSRALRNRTLRFLGKYSYCLYVVHVMIRAVMVRVVGDPIVVAGTQLIWQLGFIVLCGGISIAVALLSWHLMEKRFLALKERFPY
jgi:peptidoglycan/LPS O-acetylase OafA/YrhL